MDVWEAIRKKRAVRHYTDEPLPEDVVRRIIDAGRRAQSAKNTQPWDFIAVQDREMLQKLSDAGAWLRHVARAALVVGIVTPSPEGNERYPWNMFDAGQAASYMQLAALELGVGSCPGTIYDEDLARDLLGIPPDRSFRLLLTFGYPAERQRRPSVVKKGGRRPLDEVVHWERW